MLKLAIEDKYATKTLPEKCPNTEFFLVRIFLYSDWIQENMDQKKFRIWTFFMQWNTGKELETSSNILKNKSLKFRKYYLQFNPYHATNFFLYSLKTSEFFWSFRGIHTAQKMKFSIKDLFSKFEEILNGKLHFLCSVKASKQLY